MASRAVRQARNALFARDLEVFLDSDGKMAVKAGHLFRRRLHKVLNEIVEEARQDVLQRHHVTGSLRRSIKKGPVYKMAGGKRLVGSVTAGSSRARYAYYVHEGTNPHVITARNTRSLRWFGPQYKRVTRQRSVMLPFGINETGQKIFAHWKEYKRVPTGTTGKVFAQKVNHPGYRGDRFLNVAAAKVVAQYGGRVNLPRRGN